MKNKNKIIYLIISIILIILLIYFIFKSYKNYQIKNTPIKVELQENLNIEVYTELTLKDLIKDLNGKLIEDKKIDTTKLGEQEISFNFINEENLKVPYSFKIKVVDTTKPIISMYRTYTVEEGSNENIAKSLFCGDNYDDTPTCELIGDYDLDVAGKYPVTFIATDSSNNKTSYDFILNVVKKEEQKPSSPEKKPEIKTTDFNEVIKNYKANNNKIGIDVSHWQGNIDFQKVKEANVEFVMIRVGIRKGKDGKLTLDTKFKDNIAGFNKQKIPVGLYFFSNAKNKKQAKEEARWVIKQIKKYKVDLPIAFDWENFSSYQDYNLSFYHLTEIANTFMDTIEEAGYNSMLYGSKNYLETIWFETNHPVWLAHYTSKTNYFKEYKMWQLCDNGKVNGIDDNLVDINIMY